MRPALTTPVLSAVLAACTNSAGSGMVNHGDPYVELIAPADQATVCGTPLQVEVFVANLELVAPVEDVSFAESGTGHVDLSLNGQDASMIWQTTTDLDDVADGVWQLKAELSNANHTPVEPYAGDFAYITIDSEVCL